jgi:hypothetical protein
MPALKSASEKIGHDSSTIYLGGFQRGLVWIIIWDGWISASFKEKGHDVVFLQKYCVMKNRRIDRLATVN